MTLRATTNIPSTAFIQTTAGNHSPSGNSHSLTTRSSNNESPLFIIQNAIRQGVLNAKFTTIPGYFSAAAPLTANEKSMYMAFSELVKKQQEDKTKLENLLCDIYTACRDCPRKTVVAPVHGIDLSNYMMLPFLKADLVEFEANINRHIDSMTKEITGYETTEEIEQGKTGVTNTYEHEEIQKLKEKVAAIIGQIKQLIQFTPIPIAKEDATATA